MGIIARLKKDRGIIFVLSIFFIYAVWKAFFYCVHHGDSRAVEYWGRFINFLGAEYAVASSLILNVFGECTTYKGISVIYHNPARIIRVEEHCLAIPATVIFVGTIALFRGDWKNKLWFIPFGVLLIIAINLIRLVFLCYIFAHYTRNFFDINHSMVFVIITYSLVFSLFMLWITKFSQIKRSA